VTIPLDYAVRDGVARITIDRPEALNALSRVVRRAIGERLEQAAADPEVRAVVVRGAGGRAFSVGADVKEFNDARASTADERTASGVRWHDAARACGRPVVAAIDGFCLGGGLELALACDLRICTERSSFALPEVTLGVIPGAGGTQRLPRLIGAGPALDLILTGRRIDAAEALALGLVNRVVAPEALDDVVEELLAKLVANGALAMACAKEAVLRGADLPLDAGVAIEAELSERVMGSPEQVARAEAFGARGRA
jgi:enoyl-CoA hydratase/carnithine racemase